jgi:opacity protein-like surface antigen
MNKQLLAGVALSTLLLGPGLPAELPLKAPPPVILPDWTGGYVGFTAGIDWGSYDPRTAATNDIYFGPAANVAAVNAAGVQSIKPTGFATGVEGGYNWQSGHFLFGLEGDFEAVHLNGRANSGAVVYPIAPIPSQFVISSYGNSDFLATGRARVGYVADNHWLAYATGGLALAEIDQDFLFTDSFGVLQSARSNDWKAGWVVGGGIEAPLTGRLSLKAEYLHVDFNRITAGQTSSNIALQAFNQSGDLKANIVRIGLNYRFTGSDPWIAAPVSPAAPGKTPILKAPPAVVAASDWEVELGARAMFSSGKLGVPDPLLNNPSATSCVPSGMTCLASRLVYSDLDAVSVETFARVDHSSGLFAKGFLGAGGITDTRGKLNDEDFPVAVYSNTLSSASGHLAYAAIDGGYDVLRAPGAKVGVFVGFAWFNQNVNTYSCSQLAGDPLACSPGSFPPNFLGISQNDHFDALRVGLSTQVMLTERFKLTADAAYLPWVEFRGRDDHNARELLLPEASNRGDGVMLEAILDYNITDAWNIGFGGRFWAFNMRSGTTTFDFLGASGNFVEPIRMWSDRYGVFVQTSYKWGNTTPAVVSPVMPTKAPPILVAGPMSWTGFYVGGHVGGGATDDRWSDPFATTIVFFPPFFLFPNVAGFGDTIRATGPLAGGQVGFDWQNGQWVLGVGADASWADLRGDNTCFSGLGGLNCQHTVNSFVTVTGRLGYAWDRALAYVKAGGAWTNTTYSLLGNTGALALGAGSTSQTRGSAVAGVGVEYGLTNHWSTLLEYDHIFDSSSAVPFPTVAVINTAAISVKQSADLMKVGVNYRFDAAGPIVASR